MKTTVIQLVINHKKDLPDLPALVAGRAWTIDGVEFVADPKIVTEAPMPPTITRPEPIFAMATDYWSSLESQQARWLNTK